ncbi:MAG: restriction endonuclease subunit S [Acutalibacteraceae bacterium]
MPSFLYIKIKKVRLNNNLEQQAQAIFENTFPQIFDADTSETLKTLITFSNGKKRPETSGKVPVYGGNGILSYTNQVNAENCVIIGRVGAYCGNTFLCLGKCWISDNAIQAKSKNEKSQLFIYYLLKNAALPSRHIGTGQPLMTQGILNAIPVNIPSTQKIDNFISICEPMHNIISANNCENTRLELLRDSLLPKLMSGELDVSEIDI